MWLHAHVRVCVMLGFYKKSTNGFVETVEIDVPETCLLIRSVESRVTCAHCADSSNVGHMNAGPHMM